MSRWRETEHGVPHGEAYDERWKKMQERGESVHGEADLVSWLKPRSVLDAGCGTGRVAVELCRRGVDVVGVDLDERMLDIARSKASGIHWLLADLVDVTVPVGTPPAAVGARPTAEAAAAEPCGYRSSVRTFDVIVMAGNVMVFVAADTEAAVIANMGRHLNPGGRLVAGFQLGRTPLTLEAYDSAAADAGLTLEHRWSTWDREPYEGGEYAVSVHRAARA